jgi:hypothetical protein
MQLCYVKSIHYPEMSWLDVARMLRWEMPEQHGDRVNDEGRVVKWTGEGERRANQASAERREAGHDSHSGQ